MAGTYYAAQVGISLKAKTNSARNFLGDLLGILESMKQGLGANDAIESEEASAAYVENFALKVFGAADNEERNENITRYVSFRPSILPSDIILQFNSQEVRRRRYLPRSSEGLSQDGNIRICSCCCLD